MYLPRSGIDGNNYKIYDEARTLSYQENCVGNKQRNISRALAFCRERLISYKSRKKQCTTATADIFLR